MKKNPQESNTSRPVNYVAIEPLNVASSKAVIIKLFKREECETKSKALLGWKQTESQCPWELTKVVVLTVSR